MYRQASENDYKDVLEKIRQKTLAYGDRSLMAEFRLEQGADLPRHSHPHEQTGYLVSGEIALTIGDETHQVKPGDSWCIAGGVEHKATAFEDSVAIEVFSPVRVDFLPEA
jgi:quercetin dioxygenase-like cupin family protein